MSINTTQLVQFRHELHADPEVSGNEIRTAKKVLAFIETCHPDKVISGIGGNGIIATWDSGTDGMQLLFRAELDALPIQEINDFNYKSTIKGVSHKCGHDGHATILCGLAQHLSKNKPKSGKVHLLFQPAEENGEGAAAILSDKRFENYTPDFVFALHNLPGYKLHEIVVKDDTFTASVNSILINLEGKTAHAAEPENGINPALAVSEIIKECLAIENNYPDRDDMSVITPVYMELGEKAYGISAGNASVHFTIRCWNDENLLELQKKIESISERTAKKYSLKISFDFTQTFHANMNHKEAADTVRSAAKSNDFIVTEKKYPFKWGEDFGLFTKKFNGCMFGLGAGTNMPALHNPDYDFPDDLIESGVKIFAGIINTIQQ